MSLDSPAGRRSISPASSGRSSPVPRASRRAVEDGVYKADKQIRRYAAGIERALASWEANPQEWADYIAFLGRLLKAIQSHPKDVPILPCSPGIASRLAQCLNPALPSGVHQRALEVYAYIFELLGTARLSTHLHEFLPGLSTVLSFASLSVRPGLYYLFEDYITQLPADDLRPALKSLILSVLPALEDETSEDFDRAFALLEKLRSIFDITAESADATELRGRYWQCVFLATITSVTRRQGALNYLVRTLPSFKIQAAGTEPDAGAHDLSEGRVLSSEAKDALNPEPGLLIRCFACGLEDPQTLIQRGFLDLMISHLPLDSHVFQEMIPKIDFDRLVTAALQILLRRDTGLNRRLWAWFLGPDLSHDAGNAIQSPVGEKTADDATEKSAQMEYFDRNGGASLERSLLHMFARVSPNPAAAAKPFRISLSLMDRWEIGGSTVSKILLPALQCAHRYWQRSAKSDAAELLRSASLFFDGVEAHLIWSSIFGVLRSAFESGTAAADALSFVSWIAKSFNISDSEMLSVHVPHIALYLTLQLANVEKTDTGARTGADVVETIRTLIELVPPRLLETTGASAHSRVEKMLSQEAAMAKVSEFYSVGGRTREARPIESLQVIHLLAKVTADTALQALEHDVHGLFIEVTSLLLVYSVKIDRSLVTGGDLLNSITMVICNQWTNGRSVPFDTLGSVVRLLTTYISDLGVDKSSLDGLQPALTAQVWKRLSPFVPKHHVEAVRLFWQLEELGNDSGDATATLTGLVRSAQEDAAVSNDPDIDNVRCFMTLWEHTVAPDDSSYSGGKNRRGSAMHKVDAENERRHLEVLTGPSYLLLDLLSAPNKRTADVVAQWLGHLPSLGRMLSMLVGRLSSIVNSDRGATAMEMRQAQRKTNVEYRELHCYLSHIRAVLDCANGFVWQQLHDVVLTDRFGQTERGSLVLAAACLDLIRRPQSTRRNDLDLDRLAVSVLHILFDGPIANRLQDLEAETTLIDTTTAVLEGPSADLQGPLLTVLSLALKVRLSAIASDAPGSREPQRASISTNSHLKHNGYDSPSIVPSSAPPPRLLSCVQAGFSANSARFYLDHWLIFLADVLPIFADAIFANLLPLVTCFCNALDQCFREVVEMSRVDGTDRSKAPETTLLRLVEALDMVLARAHECLLEEMALEPVTKPEVTKRSHAPTASTPAMFKLDGPPSKTARSNTRLTVILAFQDAVRMCLSIWVWASENADHSREDQSSSATTTHNALKIRNRTRRLLDQIFSVEPLESMEVLIAAWCQATERTRATAFLSLLHVMNCTRPRSSVPAILDALCSRTNPSELDADRRSSLTCGISAPYTALFMATYLDTLENDALDEIWIDCLAFLRTVSRDSLPYRSVLPTLLWTVMLLAEKLEKTNFGEQRKMRRDIAEMFQRLLNATLATISPSVLTDADRNDVELSSSPETSLLAGKRPLHLGPVLCRLIGNFEAVTESPDKAIALTNLVTASLLTPLLHSKAFPSNINGLVLAVLLQVAKTAPTAKSWKKGVHDAFGDTRFLSSSFDLVRGSWFPVLRQWCLNDRERMPDVLSRLTPPTSAGLMFGVGANAARLEADRRTQLGLRRACVLLLAAPEDLHAAHMSYFEEKLGELHGATTSSSPSSAIKAELFMLCRALALSISSVHLVPLWPMINDTVQSALSSLLSRSSTKAGTFTNLSLLQACKLLDLLIGLSFEEFQIHEWLYITDTIDAVYQPTEWRPLALADHVAEELGIASLDGSATVLAPPLPRSDVVSSKAPLSSNIAVDARDAKVMAREDFARAVLRPFLSQLSMHAYEGVYNSDDLDVAACKDDLLRDILDMSTIVE